MHLQSLLEASHQDNLAPKLYFLNKLASKLALEFLERGNIASFNKYPRICSVIEIIFYCILKQVLHCKLIKAVSFTALLEIHFERISLSEPDQ